MIIQKTTTGWITQQFDIDDQTGDSVYQGGSLHLNDEVSYEDEMGDPISLTEDQVDKCVASTELEDVEAWESGGASTQTALAVIRSMGLTPDQLGELINCLMNGGKPTS